MINHSDISVFKSASIDLFVIVSSEAIFPGSSLGRKVPKFYDAVSEVIFRGPFGKCDGDMVKPMLCYVNTREPLSHQMSSVLLRIAASALPFQNF